MAADNSKDTIQAGIPGSLWIVRFDKRGRAEPGSAADLDALAEPRDSFVWLHMDLTDVRARQQIGRIAALSESAREALCEPLDHQYLERSGGFVSGALLDHERTLAGPASSTDFLRFAIADTFIVTARRRPMNCVDAAKSAVGRGIRAATPLSLFEMMVTNIVDELPDGGRHRLSFRSPLSRKATVGP